jgi:ATP-dependent Lon protease
VDEIGLFPLGIVLLPGEQVPLHIFEPRYRELIGECIERDGEFGIVFADEGGAREIGTRARVTHVLERFEDGRLNVAVTGGERFRVERLTRGRSFMTALVEPVDDGWEEPDAVAAQRAVEAFRAVAAAAGAEDVEVDAAASQLSYELAAHVELAPDGKQRLVESTSENERLRLVAELLDEARRVLLDAHDLAERAKRNGSRT